MVSQWFRHVAFQVSKLTALPGKALSTYTVEDKKQVADFDPQAWIDDQVDELDSTPCPICGSADSEEVLLLCDACDAPYHTHCVGLDRVPSGPWFCMECDYEGLNARSDPSVIQRSVRRPRQPRTFAQRTQAQIRQGRRRAPTDDWHGAWSQISGRVWDALNLDLDYSDEDQSLATFRQHQSRTERERREFQQWQQRLNIARRQGARDVFRYAARPMLRSKTPEDTPEEAKAWEAFENARDSDLSGSSSRKRKAKSVTRSPVEQSAQPERKLKRPKTRRLVNKPGSPSDSGPSNRRNRSAASSSTTQRSSGSVMGRTNGPTFLSSLLREVEMSASTDDEVVQLPFGYTAMSPSVEYSSPAGSPASSTYSTPKPVSTTPPPRRNKRSGSPLPMTSRIEPLYPPAEFSIARSSVDYSYSDGDRSGPASPPTSEICQPQPLRRQFTRRRSGVVSPARAQLSIEAKEGINKIVRTALEPYYREPARITKEQYVNINRLVSRMLYEKIPDPDTLDEKEKCAWEKVATAEVTKAVEALSA